MSDTRKDIDQELMLLLGKNAYHNSLELYTVDSEVSRLVRLANYLITQVQQTGSMGDDAMRKEHVEDVLKGVLDIIRNDG